MLDTIDPTTTDDLRIREIRELSTPASVIAEVPRTAGATRAVTRARRAIHDILHGNDDRLVGVIGPCSVHDPAAELVSWAAIGARTTESQVHRELASGTSCPVGFKNGTGGDVKIAVDAVQSASQPHHFLAVTKSGRSAIAATAGNEDCHVILRGGKTPNYDAASVETACALLVEAGLAPAVMIDASHANSSKTPENQPLVIDDIADQVAGGDERIIGVMVESHLVAGRQDVVAGQPLAYGQSITHGCIGWDTTVAVLEHLAAAVAARRRGCGSGRARAAATG